MKPPNVSLISTKLSAALIPTFFIAVNPYLIYFSLPFSYKENLLLLSLISGGKTSILFSFDSLTNKLILSELLILEFIDVIKNSSK